MNPVHDDKYFQLQKQVDNIHNLIMNPMIVKALDPLKENIDKLPEGELKESLKERYINLSLKNEYNKSVKDQLMNETIIESNNALKKANEFEKKKKDSPFLKFVQVNKDYLDALVILARNDSMAISILLYMMSRIDKYNQLVISYEILMNVFGCSRMTISRAIKMLKELNYIKIDRISTCNVYTINKRIIWNSWGTNYNYCNFSPNILLNPVEGMNLKKRISNTKINRTNVIVEKEVD